MQKELLKCGCRQASLDQVGQVEQQRRHVLRTKETTRAPSQPPCCREHKGRESPTVTEATTPRGGRPRRLPAWSALVTQRFGVCGKPRPHPEASWPRPSALSWTWLPSRPSSLWPCGPLSAHVPRNSLSLLSNRLPSHDSALLHTSRDPSCNEAPSFPEGRSGFCPQLLGGDHWASGASCRTLEPVPCRPVPTGSGTRPGGPDARQ